MMSYPQDASASGAVPALEAEALEVRYASTQALRGVSMSVAPSTIHALVGENGAGKSTFLGVAAGRVQASSGAVRIHGQGLESGSPRAARRLGVAAVYQELMVVQAMTALDNVFLGGHFTRRGFVARRRMLTRYQELCAELGVEIPAQCLMRELSVADQQALEIMRGLQAQANVLLFDEPTSALAVRERERLFATIRSLKQRAVTVMFVSHDLGEVLALADRVTVFRDGSLVETRPATDWSRQELVAAMLGRAQLQATVSPDEHHEDSGVVAGQAVLTVQGLWVPGVLHGIELSVRAGEILGIAGLVGSGRSSLLRVLAGDSGVRAQGRLAMAGQTRRLPRTPAQAGALGIGYVPEDRRRAGLVLGMTALENVVLPDLARRPLAFFSRRVSVKKATEAASLVGFAPDRLGTITRYLSGGNQQKLLLARWVTRAGLKVILADEPTRGVDVGAKAEILSTLRMLANGGLAIIVVSSELEELEAAADRVLVLARGRMVAELHSADDGVTVARMLSAIFAAAPEADSELGRVR
jgi:ABC-type sugar transport system ATPase subunit